MDRPAITTDVIVGFPGETEAEFQQTLDTCRAAGFSKIHAFPYSARRGTPAAEMPNQIPKSLRRERTSQLMHLGETLASDYRRGLVGIATEVLIESDTGTSTGTTERYVPVTVENARPPVGEFYRGVVTGVGDTVQ